MDKTFRTSLVAILFFTITILLFFQLSDAQASKFLPIVTKTCTPAGIPGLNSEPCDFNTFTGTIQNAIKVVVVNIAPALAMIFILWGGFLMMLGGPNPGNIKKGQDIIFTALVGYILVLLSGFIIDLVLTFLGGAAGIGGIKFGK